MCRLFKKFKRNRIYFLVLDVFGNRNKIGVNFHGSNINYKLYRSWFKWERLNFHREHLEDLELPETIFEIDDTVLNGTDIVEFFKNKINQSRLWKVDSSFRNFENL